MTIVIDVVEGQHVGQLARSRQFVQVLLDGYLVQFFTLQQSVVIQVEMAKHDAH